MSKSFRDRAANLQLIVRVALGVLLAANLAAAALVLFPVGGSPEDLERRFVSLRSQVQSRQGLLERTRQHAAAVEKGRAEGDRFLDDYFLANRSHMSALLTELDAAAAQTQITPREHAFAVEPIEGSESLRMLTITASYEGTYSDLMHFVHQLDRSPRLLIIESLSAAPPQGGGLLNINMKLDTFVRDDGTGFGPDGSTP